jgi:Ca2+-binding EF-hand superfamily protein
MVSDPLRERFERVDTDGNGKIDEAELGRLLQSLGAGFTESQVQAAFAAIDADASGHVELEEFRTWWQSL